MTIPKRMVVLYGSQTFTAQELAEKVWRTTKALGFTGPVQALDEYPISKLIHEDFVVFVVATTGQGDEPDNMKKFWRFLLRKNLPSSSLGKLKFGVLGLGDSSYAKFNFTAKKLHKRLMQLGATSLIDAGLCDYQHDLGHDAVMQPWLKTFFTTIKNYFPEIEPEETKSRFIPRWKVNLLKDNKENIGNGNEDIYFSNGIKDSFCEGKLFKMERNVRTTDESHFQDVRLLKLRTSDDTKLNYNPGDIFNIRPRNSEEDVDLLFQIFRQHGLDIEPHYRLKVEECHKDMPVPRFLQSPLSLRSLASQYWDLKFIPTQYVFSLLAIVSDDKLERDKCLELSTPEGQEDWLNYCRRPRRTVLEVLQDFHKSTSKLTIDIIFELFSTIKPRSFSIASSSQTNAHTLDILVAVVKYYSKLKAPRLGLCSNWLKDLKVGQNVWGWVKKGSMVFPEHNTPQILIGPGTGLAPFLSQIHHLSSQGLASKDNLHLFFGCRYKEKDFHCREELERLEKEGNISLYAAFSRDQEEKIYVQHKITEHRDLLWHLINDKKAWIFISGSSKNMPDNVKDAFIQDVMMKSGGMGEVEAKAMVKEMEDRNRWQVETW